MRKDWSNLLSLAAWQAPDAPAPIPGNNPPADPAPAPAPAPTPAPGDAPKPVDAPKPADAPKPSAINEPEPAALTVENIKLPEGFKADNAVMTGFLETLSNTKLSPTERAQALVDMHVKSLTAAQEAVNLQMDQTEAGWKKSIASDKDFGSGDEKSPLKPEAKAIISKAIDAYGGAELRQALDLTGAGNHPAIVSAFYKMAKILSEGNYVGGSPPSKPQAQTAAQKLYPDLPTQG